MSVQHGRRFFVGTCFGIASTVFFPNILFAIPLPDRGENVNLKRRLRFRLGLQNTLAHGLVNQKFWCYMPLESERQSIHEIEVSMPYRLKTDYFGHRILELSFDEVPGYFQKIVTLDIVVRFNEGQLPKALSKDLDWVKNERFIESDSPLIISLAKQLRRESHRQTIEAIYSWVSDNIEYAGFLPDDFGASYALENRRGDCTEHAYLVAALARVNKIPAKVIGGYVADHDLAPKPQDYHNWAEVFVNDRWFIIDAQKRCIYPASGKYVAFRIYSHVPINDVGTAHRYRIDGQLQVSF
ncbi:transglutaminase-like domain-containing protein [Iodobacter ciconiae]|uniref:Transglutaminase-like domain-containing protein n=1 Tax=Iodobacter ciconiae TaxID=2496266 RepID=A0A3S8ZPS3_9NEIS|nr:transglutaminase domain-containing protein [Iodobacter ciconiae]AZN35480.1 hypothetical protein EJO50_02645 [Iodobacter ciconiae]